MWEKINLQALGFNIDKVSLITIIKNEENVEIAQWDKELYPYTPKNFIDRLKKGQFGDKIGIVWGTTRHHPTDCTHPGYISDAMYIPEVIQAINNINSDIHFKSFLDIDLTEDVLIGEYSDYNFILCGDGEVNCMVSMLLNRFKYSSIEIKYEDPTSRFFEVRDEKFDSRSDHNSIGEVQFLKSRWHNDRFIIFAGGIGPIGTIASLKWLSDALANPESKLPDYPFIVVHGTEKSYSTEFDGYKEHCKECCIFSEGESTYYEGKISNVLDVIPIYFKRE